MTHATLAGDRATAARSKTGRVGGTPLTSMGRARMALIRARHEAMDAHPTHVLVSEATTKAYPDNGDHYRNQFAKVRAEAAKTVPSCAEIRDQDLRDTAFTWMKNAGLSDDGIASRTLQSRKHIADLGDAHYGEIGREISDPAGRQFDRYLVRQGVGP
jgi:integrase